MVNFTNQPSGTLEATQVQDKTSAGFTGPLFVVGMQRSGTKLLRTLLNEHPRINILSAETHFLPHWVKTWDKFGDLSDPATFSAFYQHMQKCPYFIHTKNRNSDTRQQTWYDLCENFTPAGVYEALMRCDTGLAPSSDGIWGDKSTSYLYHLPVLKALFPEAKIIHIVRDVRDYCLSQHKAWRKNMIRAAQRWVNGINKVKAEAQQFPNDYLEIKYEDLLADPETQLQRCCEFLGVEPDSTMLTLSQAPENIGDAKGYQKIKSDNKDKYLTDMNPQLRQKLEAIASETLTRLGYSVEYSGQPYRLSKLEMSYYRILDGINFVLNEARRNGFLKTLQIEIGSYMTSRVQK